MLIIGKIRQKTKINYKLLKLNLLKKLIKFKNDFN